ncbi:hypothetical protein TOPH_06744 [Tolypocladium ophioglossoides CBS 100239]|uniref:N-acetyltransferase domain-containing protein n=1 Tax=Tolypocladium ophioglossoides (strain CBS 100239) TaxID=1163406 RepID=A0A0L0N3M7_TOLOC|nr:hypothetical protein TOPH_06744 [Tolypocladium ophioglossoides CBS 100239]
MSLHVSPASAADAPRSVAIEDAAYGPNPSGAAMFPGPFPPGDQVRVNALRTQLADDPACRWAKVVDSGLEAAGEDGMVAFSMWYFWSTPRDTLPPRPAWGPGTNPDACELFFGAMREEWLRRWAGKPHVYLKQLHTDPAHQRRGAGSMLLKWGVAEADRLGLPTYLEATEEGRPLYEKHGFRPVGKLVTDLSEWNGPAEAETVLMVRPPSES